MWQIPNILIQKCCGAYKGRTQNSANKSPNLRRQVAIQIRFGIRDKSIVYTRQSAPHALIKLADCPLHGSNYLRVYVSSVPLTLNFNEIVIRFASAASTLLAQLWSDSAHRRRHNHQLSHMRIARTLILCRFALGLQPNICGITRTYASTA